MTADIDYLLQFKEVSEVVALAEGLKYRRVAMYDLTEPVVGHLAAERAFKHAKRVEDRGSDVAFARVGDVLYVWTVPLPEGGS